jgi:hypothetical protein
MQFVAQHQKKLTVNICLNHCPDEPALSETEPNFFRNNYESNTVEEIAKKARAKALNQSPDIK